MLKIYLILKWSMSFFSHVEQLFLSLEVLDCANGREFLIGACFFCQLFVLYKVFFETLKTFKEAVLA